MSEQKKVTNLVFRFKEGACASLAAKLFSLTISRMEFFNGLADPILIPLPASTKERHRQRFESFCGELSRRLIIDDGFPAVRIEYDREQQKGTQLFFTRMHQRLTCLNPRLGTIKIGNVRQIEITKYSSADDLYKCAV